VLFRSDLNAIQQNHPTYDLEAHRQGHRLKISVKCARAKRDLSLGSPASVRRLEPGSFVFAFLPPSKDREIDIATGAYALWIVPAVAVINDALAAHAHYWHKEPDKLESNPIRVKDKADKPGGRSISGAVFADWSARFNNAWHLLYDAE